jgi:hypothetical protein
VTPPGRLRTSWLAVALIAALFATAACDRGAAPSSESSFSRPTEDDLADDGPAPARPAKSAPTRPRERAAADLHSSDSGVSTSDGGGFPSERATPSPTLSPEARAMAESLGEAAASLSEDVCEQSFNTLKALARGANRAVPRRADYMQACGELSPPMQRCLLPAYREEHQLECEQARARTEPSALQRLREVIEGPTQ